MDIFAFEEAAEHFEHALGALERIAAADPIRRFDLLLALGSAYDLGGHYERYRESFREAAQLARRCGDAERFAEAVSSFARYQGAGFFDEEGMRLLEEALEVLGPSETPLRAESLCRLAMLLFVGGQLGRADWVLAEAIELARRFGGPEIEAWAANCRTWLLLGRGHPEEVLKASDEALRLAEAARNVRVAAGVALPRLHALLTLGALAEADAELARLAQYAPWYRYARFTLAEYPVMKALLTGRLHDAERLIEEAQELVRRMRDPFALNNLASAIHLLRREQGRLSELEPGVRAWAEQHPGIPAWRCALAHLLAELGRTEEARREFESLAASRRRRATSRLPSSFTAGWAPAPGWPTPSTNSRACSWPAAQRAIATALSDSPVAASLPHASSAW